MASCPRLRPRAMLQAGRSSLPLRKLELDAEGRFGRDRRHSGGFLLRIMPPSWHPVPACAPRLCCRRAIRCSNDGAAAIRKFGPEIQNHCTMEGISGRKPAAIPNFTPSNQESLHDERRVNGEILRKFLLSILQNNFRFSLSIL